ncbi:MAG TPA: Ku protein [Bacillota bacterium]|nr:Ku protein [Bacillota bacterium]
MRSMWKGAISFGLVNIPVKLYTATEKKDIKFNYLHSVCQTPVQYKKICPHCNREVPMEEIIRGYEYEKGKYVIIAEEDLENVPAVTTRAVEILDFVDLAEIDPLFYDKSYYLAPGEGGQKPYALLKRAMEDTGKIAIARVVIRSKQALAAIRVHEDALVLETMFFPDELRSAKYISELDFTADLHDNELKMAVSLIENLAAPFQPEKYTDEYRAALQQVIQGKIAGEEVTIPAPAAGGKVVDLMEALRASIQLAKEEKSGHPGAAQGEEPPAAAGKAPKKKAAKAAPRRKTS